jgi:hypothetical protein
MRGVQRATVVSGARCRAAAKHFAAYGAATAGLDYNIVDMAEGHCVRFNGCRLADTAAGRKIQFLAQSLRAPVVAPSGERPSRLAGDDGARSFAGQKR